MENTVCKNCEAHFNSAFTFCPHCGQKVNEELTLGVLFNNTIKNYFSVDARFFKSFLPLLFKPGYLAKTFIIGKRQLYLHPAQFYLFISIVFFFLFSFIVRDNDQKIHETIKSDFNNFNAKKNPVSIDSIISDATLQLDKTGKNIKKTASIDSIIDTTISNEVKKTPSSFNFKKDKVDSLIMIKADKDTIYKTMGMKDNADAFTRKVYAQALKFYENKGGNILGAFFDTLPISMFILLPIFAFILKLLFFKSGVYAHHLVFSFYYFAFLFMLFSIILLINFIVDIPDWIDMLLVFSAFFYLIFAVKRFYGKTFITSFFRSSIATMVYFTFVIPIAVFFMGMAAFMFY